MKRAPADSFCVRLAFFGMPECVSLPAPSESCLARDCHFSPCRLFGLSRGVHIAVPDNMCIFMFLYAVEAVLCMAPTPCRSLYQVSSSLLWIILEAVRVPTHCLSWLLIH